MKRNLNKQPSAILSMLLFSIGLLISFNIFLITMIAKPALDIYNYATIN